MTTENTNTPSNQATAQRLFAAWEQFSKTLSDIQSRRSAFLRHTRAELTQKQIDAIRDSLKRS